MSTQNPKSRKRMRSPPADRRVDEDNHLRNLALEEEMLDIVIQKTEEAALAALFSKLRSHEPIGPSTPTKLEPSSHSSIITDPEKPPLFHLTKIKPERIPHQKFYPTAAIIDHLNLNKQEWKHITQSIKHWAASNFQHFKVKDEGSGTPRANWCRIITEHLRGSLDPIVLQKLDGKAADAGFLLFKWSERYHSSRRGGDAFGDNYDVAPGPQDEDGNGDDMDSDGGNSDVAAPHMEPIGSSIPDGSRALLLQAAVGMPLTPAAVVPKPKITVYNREEPNSKRRRVSVAKTSDPRNRCSRVEVMPMKHKKPESRYSARVRRAGGGSSGKRLGKGDHPIKMEE
ncbi:hypothetical protein TWF730_007381 [Orbilia blumenaviensis]|uniref:Uncharacterized protein n=1 Tax=Orbilia blumenaviensis TaxID=1796055 RepID=A0AAV9VBG1_9PEZI